MQVFFPSRKLRTFSSWKVIFCKLFRPMECADEQGCILDESGGYPKINLQESISFPISIIDDKKVMIHTVREKPSGHISKINISEHVTFPYLLILLYLQCEIIDDDCWNQTLKKKKEKAPACIEVIRNLEDNAHGIGGVRNLIVI